VIKTGFIGEYDHTLDQKGRVSVPSKFKKYIEEITTDPDAKAEIILLKGDNKCIIGFPAQDWERMILEHRQGTTLKNIAEGSDLMDISRRAAEASIDKSGRIVIPPALKEFAGIKKAVTFIGVIDRFQIWDKEELKRFDGK
jgi:MraZ protein